MGVMRAIIDWCDTKKEEAYAEPNAFKASAKAFVGGFVEGFCDGSVMMYPLLVATLWVVNRELTKKE